MLTNERLDAIKRYRTICSEIIEGKLYLGGYYIACDWDKLEENKITHIINLSGDTCINVFQDKLEYKTYYVLDTPQESIEGVLYDSIEWIDTKLKENNENRIYVHCQEGVSRSSSIVIGYLMWKYSKSFNDASDYVKERRSTSSPNIGFTYQLLLFQKALNSTKLNISTGDEGGNAKAEFPSIIHLGKRHWVTSLKLYYMSKYGIPVSLINWKGDGNHGFTLNSSKIYLLRQSLLEEVDNIRREKLWIWIGSQIKDGIRESILGALRFCRQILKIEMGYYSSLELENLEIRTDLIIGALGDDKNLTSEYITNILSSTIILEYFHEFSESEEFMQILAPTNLHSGIYCNVMQRSFSSPSIKNISESVIPLGFEDDSLKDEEEGNVEDSKLASDQILNSEPGSSNSELSSLISLDESLSYFSSFASSNGSPVHSRNSPTNFKNTNDESVEAVARNNQHHFSLDSQKINYTREHLLDKSNGIEPNSSVFNKVVIPKLNFTFKRGESSFEIQHREQKHKHKQDHDQEQQDREPGTDFVAQSSEKDNIQKKNQHSAFSNQNEIFCYSNSSSSYSKKSSISQESLYINEDTYSALNKGGTKIMLFRFPDYFASESLRFFDSEDLLPGSVCPLIIIEKIASETGKDKDERVGEQLASLPTSPDKDSRNIVIYLWIGSKTIYFNQAKEILSQNFGTTENHNNYLDVKSLLIGKTCQNSHHFDNDDHSAQINHFELDITQLLILLIRNNSKLSLKDIKSIYFEFEGEESNSFWNYFYQ